MWEWLVLTASEKSERYIDLTAKNTKRIYAKKHKEGF